MFTEEELKSIRKEARRITRRSDLPSNRGIVRLEWGDGFPDIFSTMVAKRDGQVAQALMSGPVFCASPVRVGDSVLRLRRDHGLPIETARYDETYGDEHLHFGIYVLTMPVRFATSKVEGK